LIVACARITVVTWALEDRMGADTAWSTEVIGAGVVVVAALRFSDALADSALVLEGAVIPVVTGHEPFDRGVDAAAHGSQTAVVCAGVFVIAFQQRSVTYAADACTQTCAGVTIIATASVCEHYFDALPRALLAAHRKARWSTLIAGHDRLGV
jgi:hypothetical protein